MLLEIAERFNVDLGEVPIVGDSLRDLQAAVTAGGQPVLVRTGKGARTEVDPELPAGTRIFDNLAALVRALTVATD
jgi:D-glycero-D-manno-heptose 1,7-bisphosphate phosphatase